ncbi:MAG: hypothetical protein JRI59_09665 [Deltaproteobacteria bacterium]|nr:hypothetical protein [Deltaproteobacteria bacterium]
MKEEHIQIILTLLVRDDQLHIAADADLGRIKGRMRVPVLEQVVARWDELMARFKEGLENFIDVHRQMH